MKLLQVGIGGTSKFSSSEDGVVLWQLPGQPRFIASLAKKAGGALEEVQLRCPLRIRDGFVYLEVPDEIIDGFFEMLPGRGLDKPEAATDKEYVGAHVSVMRPEEHERIVKKKKRVREIDEDFAFTLDKLYSTEPEGWDGVKEVFFVSVKSPELEALRKKYGLSKLLNGHDFHITVGVRRRK